MRSIGIIVAGGSGRRMNSGLRKQYRRLAGVSILGRTLAVFDACGDINGIVLAVPFEDITYCLRSVIDPLPLKTPVRVIAGGAERQESVYNGLLAAAEEGAELTVIHDGVRPFVSVEAISQSIQGAVKTGACILGIPSFDTVKEVDEDGRIKQTLCRKRMWLAQTPQAFRIELILAAHEAARREGFRGTDDASLVERLGKPVMVIPGSRRNIKITTPEDLLFARALLELHP